MLILGKIRNKVFTSAQYAEALILHNAAYVQHIELPGAGISLSTPWTGGVC